MTTYTEPWQVTCPLCRKPQTATKHITRCSLCKTLFMHHRAPIRVGDDNDQETLGRYD